MNTVDIIVHFIAELWVASEILLSITRRIKDQSRVYKRNNSRLGWIINILSISIGISIASRSGNGEMGNITGDHLLLSFAGLLLILSGIAVRWIAIRTLKQHFTTSLTIIDNHKLIDTGIYQYVRHPSYTGGLMSFLGLSVTFSNWITIIVMFVPILLSYLYRIQVEEKMLTDHFGEAYIEYGKKTRKLIPKIY
jgi:protein-S-isoprenylcysteine O-methyltransferase Ste14